MRVPFISSFISAPFEKLVAFCSKVQEGMKALREAVLAYLNEDYEHFDAWTNKVISIEQEADEMKRQIRNSLPRGVFMPVDKFQFFTLLRELDQILDRAEDIVVWLSFKRGMVIKEIKGDLLELLDTSIEAVEILCGVVKMTTEAFGFIKKRREEIKQEIRSVRYKEWESDQIAQCMIRRLFTLEGYDFLTIHHILRASAYVGNIADHAENAADIIRVMIAR